LTYPFRIQKISCPGLTTRWSRRGCDTASPEGAGILGARLTAVANTVARVLLGL
jgi:hypothetical protein